jgi:hypothetical protein
MLGDQAETRLIAGESVSAMAVFVLPENRMAIAVAASTAFVVITVNHLLRWGENSFTVHSPEWPEWVKADRFVLGPAAT